jgi:hypothetical protein
MDNGYMVAIVEQYIYERKGVRVKINIQSSRDVLMLRVAYNIAYEWMLTNNKI